MEERLVLNARRKRLVREALEVMLGYIDDYEEDVEQKEKDNAEVLAMLEELGEEV